MTASLIATRPRSAANRTHLGHPFMAITRQTGFLLTELAMVALQRGRSARMNGIFPAMISLSSGAIMARPIVNAIKAIDLCP